jgi:beta-glucosidase
VLALRRFERVTLAAGEARTVAFTLRGEDLAFPGANLQPVVEPGFFTVGVGGSSADLKQGRFELVP